MTKKNRNLIKYISIPLVIIFVVMISLAYYNQEAQHELARENFARSNRHNYTEGHLDWSSDHDFRNGERIAQSQDNNHPNPKEAITNLSNNSLNNKPPTNQKIVYLTFDDGPSEDITPLIIDTLNKYKIKATFFIIGKNAEKYPDLVTLESSEGFTVANHTYSHDIKYLYSNPKNLVADFDKNDKVLKAILPGFNCSLVRFPGGSKQQSRNYYNSVTALGYRIIDWNCLSKDAENPKYTVTDLVNNVKRSSYKKNNLIVLMHDSDGRQTTLESLPIIIDYFKSQGYEFGLLK